MSDYLTSGRLEDQPFANLAGKIFRENRSGDLVLESAQRRRTVWFLGGNPVAVVSDDPQDHLAQVLLEHGKISPEEAQRLAGMPETREALGKADFLSKETLNWGVKSRFVNLCYDLFRWEEGDYAFTEGEPPRDLIYLKVPAHSLIFKGVGFLARSTVLEAVPDDAVCGAGTVPADGVSYLGPEVREFLDQCRTGHSVAEVLAGRDDPDQDRRLIYALVCLGLVALSHGTAAGTGDSLPAQEQEEGFTLEDESEGLDVEEAPPAASAWRAPEPSPPPMPKEPDYGFSLPPLGTEEPAHGEAPGAGSELPEGSLPFESDASAGPFPSFDLGLSPPPIGGTPASTGEEHEAPQAKSKKSGRSFHLPRWAGIALGSVAAAVVIGAAGWWWLGGEQKPSPPVKPPTKRPATVPTTPSPTAPPSTATTPAPAAVPAPPPSPTSTPAPVPPPVSQTPTPAPALMAAAVAKAPAPPSTTVPVAATSGARYGNGQESFEAGNFEDAAAAWERLLYDQHRGDFTLQLMTACQGDSLRAIRQTFPAQQIYLISKKIDGRVCYRACLGIYDSRESASRALAALPAGYRTAGAAVRPVDEVLRRDR